MGRPPLNLTRVPVRLEPEDIERIKARVGTYGLSKFVREAVAEKLEREKP